jgi:hypothetical protein
MFDLGFFWMNLQNIFYCAKRLRSGCFTLYHQQDNNGHEKRKDQQQRAKKPWY